VPGGARPESAPGAVPGQAARGRVGNGAGAVTAPAARGRLRHGCGRGVGTSAARWVVAHAELLLPYQRAG